MICNVLAAAVVVALGSMAFGGDPKSGPQTGDKLPGPFSPLNINGESAGKKACLYCKAGDSPAIAIFAHNADNPALAKLLVAVEDATAKNAKAELNSFAVFCSDNQKLEAQLKQLADTSKLNNVVLAIEVPEGPEKYNISKDAELTVLVYKERVVSANFTFEKGKFGDKDIEKVLAEIAKIVK